MYSREIYILIPPPPAAPGRLHCPRRHGDGAGDGGSGAGGEVGRTRGRDEPCWLGSGAAGCKRIRRYTSVRRLLLSGLPAQTAAVVSPRARRGAAAGPAGGPIARAGPGRGRSMRGRSCGRRRPRSARLAAAAAVQYTPFHADRGQLPRRPFPRLTLPIRRPLPTPPLL